VVYVKRGLFKICGWGVVTGRYQYDNRRETHKHILPIDWKSNKEFQLPEGIQLPSKTLTPISNKHDLVRAIDDFYGTEPDGRIYTKEDALRDLFMEESKLDEIVQQLRRKKNVVLQGAPGTGKTFVARRLAYLLMGERDPERAPMVQFHQSISYEDFIQGYRPNGDGGFSLKNGGFYDFCQVARSQPDKKFVYIIDEINRGNLSKVFGELLMLIEHDKRDEQFAVPLTYAASSQDRFFVPPNVYLIGTMNSADRSLSMVDYALRRRFAFIRLHPGFDSPIFAEVLKASGASDALIDSIRKRMNELNELIQKDSVNLGRGYRIGHSYFVPTNGHSASEDWLNEVIECEIVPLLEEYWCDDEAEVTKACRIARGEQ